MIIRMDRFYAITALLCLCLSNATAIPKEKRALGIFNVVKFPNSVCEGSGNQDGTCYTAEECEARDGTSAGSCAEGYGVCCTISLACGESSSENCTYLTQLATTAPANPACTYTICPLNTNICRIKLDFAGGFVLAPPIGATAAAAAAENAGICQVDTFTVAGAPTLCGLNTNQHIFVDVDGTSCIKPTFVFGANAVNRQYNIKVLQYDCRNRDLGGPSGCLQYHSTDTGTIANFNYNIGSDPTPTGANDVHLANLNYKICIRQSAGNCAICYVPTILRTAAMAAADAGVAANVGLVSSFGLSKSMNLAAVILQASLGTECTTDWIEIMGGQGATAAATATAQALLQINDPSITLATATQTDRFCGNFFAGILNGAVDWTSEMICSSTTPYTVRVVTDATEIAAENDLATAMGDNGHVGFSLDFTMAAC